MSAASDGIFQVRKAVEIDRLIAHAVTLDAGHYAELLRAVRAGRINFVQVDRSGVPSIGQLKRSSRPVLTLIGDDDYCTSGPCGWAATKPILRWATYAILHGTGATVEQYQAIAGLAEAYRRLVLIETNSAALADWADALRRARVPFLLWIPTNGLHPLPLPQVQVQ